MRFFSIPILLVMLLIASACISAEKPPPEKPAPVEKPKISEAEPEKKPAPPKEPAAPEGPKPEITDDMKRGVIPGGGAESCDAVLSALEDAMKKKDADAVWKLLASEPRREITREMTGFKFALISKPEEGKVDFLGRKAAIEEVCSYPVQKILLNAAAAGLDCEAHGRRFWYRYTMTIIGFLEDLGKIKRLAETTEKDGRRADIFVRIPDDIDVHLWFVKEGGRWFFHSPRGGVPPEADWPIPEFVAPGKVEINLSTPEATIRTFAAAAAAANPIAYMKCLPESDRRLQEERGKYKHVKTVSAGVPPDQEHVYSIIKGLTWHEIRSLPAEKFMENARLTEDDKLEAEIGARTLLEAELREISNDGKTAVVEAIFPEASGYPPQEFSLVKEADGWKMKMPEREQENRETGKQKNK